MHIPEGLIQAKNNKLNFCTFKYGADLACRQTCLHACKSGKEGEPNGTPSMRSVSMLRNARGLPRQTSFDDCFVMTNSKDCGTFDHNYTITRKLHLHMSIKATRQNPFHSP